MSTLLISVFLMKIKFVLTGFFSVFHNLRKLLLWSLVIKSKNVLSSKIKFRKSYWISNKNNNVTCVIGWFFIILFSFSLSFICTSFMFVVGSCNFDAPENLKCVRQQVLVIKTSQISHFIHHSKGNIILSKNIFTMWQVHFKKFAPQILGNLKNILEMGKWMM